MLSHVYTVFKIVFGSTTNCMHVLYKDIIHGKINPLFEMGPNFGPKLTKLGRQSTIVATILLLLFMSAKTLRMK